MTSSNSLPVRGWLLLLAALGALAWVALFTQAFRSENEFTHPESLIANQAQNLREFGILYYSVGEYPYLVSSSMPLTYALGAVAQALGVTPIQAGRLVSILSLAWLTWLVWSVLRLYVPGDRRVAALGVALCGCSVTLAAWGTVGQANLPAVAFTVAAFLEFSKHWLGRAHSLWRAGLFAVLGLFSQQTVLAVPVAMIAALWLRRRKASALFAVSLTAAGFILLAAIDALCEGRFLRNTIAAGFEAISFDKLREQAGFWIATACGLLLIALLGARRMWRAETRPVLLWLAGAVVMLAFSAGRVGSGADDLVEATVALIVAACLALYVLGFFDTVFTASSNAAAMLLMPLMVFVLVNLRLELATWNNREAKEKEFRHQVELLAPRLPEAGRILSADLNVLQRLGRRIEVDPLMYRLLVKARRIAPQRLTEDLANGLFATVLLYHPASDPAEPGLETPTLTREQRAVVDRRYKQVAWVPGPYAGGLYVYEPR